MHMTETGGKVITYRQTQLPRGGRFIESCEEQPLEKSSLQDRNMGSGSYSGHYLYTF